MAASYTVVLTKGAHTVRSEDAQAIFDAIEAGKKLVDVGVELFPGSPEVHPTTIVTAHIVALAPVETVTARAEVAATNGKVSSLWRKQL